MEQLNTTDTEPDPSGANDIRQSECYPKEYLAEQIAKAALSFGDAGKQVMQLLERPAHFLENPVDEVKDVYGMAMGLAKQTLPGKNDQA